MRTLRKVSPKELGIAIGFSPYNASSRICVYESEKKRPKIEITNAIADELGIDPCLISEYDPATPEGLLCTIFELEELYGMRFFERDGELYFMLPKQTAATEVIKKWGQIRKLMFQGKITYDEYLNWKHKQAFDLLKGDK
jgi:hypothetical protein